MLTCRRMTLFLTEVALVSIASYLSQLLLVSLLPINNPQIYSPAIARQCLRQCLPLAPSRLLSATLGIWPIFY